MDEIQEHMAHKVGREPGVIVTVEDLDRITSNMEPVCLVCGVDITDDNNSGWEGFADAWTTQPLCQQCHEEGSKDVKKEAQG